MLKVLSFLKLDRWLVVGVLFLLILQTLGELTLPRYMALIINDGVMRGDTAVIWSIGGRMLAISGGIGLTALAVSFLTARVSAGLGRNLRQAIFDKIENLSMRQFDDFGPATLITRTTNDVTQIQMVSVMMFRMMVAAPITAVGAVFMAYRENAGLTWVLAVAVPILLAFIILLSRRSLPLFQIVQERIDRLNLIVREKLTGLRVIRAFNQQAHEAGRFAKANFELTDNYIRVNRLMAFMMPGVMFMMNLTTLAILWFGGLKIVAGEMNLGSIAAFTQYAMQLMFSLVMFSIMFVMIPRAQVAAGRLSEILSLTPDMHSALTGQSAEETDPPAPTPAPATSQPPGTVEFRNVSFGYENAEEPVLSDISFTARPGQTTAIIGSTGSGKTTLVSLIPRFYDIQSGSILMDGIDIRRQPLAELRKRIGFVAQKTFLFTGTIRSNIAYDDAGLSDEEVRQAARISQSEKFISQLENTYDAPVAQGGANLSGGQRQRLSIARALARKPDIYIFDDSFSALDFRTDASLRQDLKTVTRDATVIVVAQRIGTVLDADQIIVLAEGRISAIGTHQTLLKDSPVYREIVASQLAEEDSA